MRLVPRKLTMQLTPLLDLLLIVIFAQFMEMRDESKSQAAKEREQTAALDDQRQELSERELRIAVQAAADRKRIADAKQNLENRATELEARLKKIQEQRDLLAKNLAAMFQVPVDSLKKTLEPLTAADAARTEAELKRLRETVKSLANGGTPRIVRHVIKYEELLKRCDIWEIHIDPSNLARITFGTTTREFRYSARMPKRVTGNDEDTRRKNKAERARYRKDLQADFEQKLFAYYKSLPQLKSVVIILLSRKKNTTLATYAAARLGLQDAADHITSDTRAQIHVVSTDLGQLPNEPNPSP